MKKSVLYLIINIALLSSARQMTAQTTLAAGDIAIIGYNSDDVALNDDFAFILLTHISSGTTIHFTDFGWCSGVDFTGFQLPSSCGASTGAASDGAISWTSSSAMLAGTQIRIQCRNNLSATAGTVTGLQPTLNFPTDYMNLAVGGDQIFAFQGSLASPTLITGINMDGNWVASLSKCLFTSSQSTLPAALGATYAMAITPEVDNAVYNCSLVSGTPSALRTAIFNPLNWLVNDVVPFTLPLSSTFTASTCSAPSITSNPPNRAICAGGNTSFSANASGTGLTYQWQVNSGSGYGNISNSAPYSGATTSTLTVTGATAVMSGYSYRCVVTGTCGTANSTGGTLTTALINTSSWSKTNVSCNGGSNGSASVLPSGGVAPYSYSWTPSGGSAAMAIGLAAGNYTVTVTDALGCTATRNYSITQPPALTSSVTFTNAACAGINNGSALVTTSGGTAPYSYAWSPSGGSAASATNLAAGSYSVLITDANSCAKTQSVAIGVNNGTQDGELAGSTSGVVTQSQSVNTAGGSYTDGSCNRITTVQPSGANPVTGNVSTKVWVESSVPVYGNEPFVARHYEITPDINAATSTGTVTLYFLQSEFDAFNAAPGSVRNLPSGPADVLGKANLRVGKYAGTSSNNSGSPASYTSGSTIIDPNDNDIIWNATDGRWEISFDVAGFSGFVVQSSFFSLPVSLVSFDIRKIDEKVQLNWRTATETNNSQFVIEHSSNGHNFVAIGSVAGAGNSNTMLSYSFIHDNPEGDINFYRIRQEDVDGTRSYSDIRKVTFESRSNSFVIRMNPVRDGKLHVQFRKNDYAFVYNASGQIVKKQRVRAGIEVIDLSGVPKGMYILQAGKETKRFVLE